MKDEITPDLEEALRNLDAARTAVYAALHTRYMRTDAAQAMQHADPAETAKLIEQLHGDDARAVLRVIYASISSLYLAALEDRASRADPQRVYGSDAIIHHFTPMLDHYHGLVADAAADAQGRAA